MKKKVVSLIVLFIVMFSFINIVIADIADKPSIDIKLINMNTSNYIIDLLVFDDDGSAYSSRLNYNGDDLTKEDIKMLYDINYDGWISESTRWGTYLLFPECGGNINYRHSFSYFGVPNVFKIVIINKATGQIKVSDVIHRKDFHSSIILDVNSMKVFDRMSISYFIKECVKVLLITILLELFVAFVMKIRNYKIILITNLVTNTLLQIFLSLNPFSYISVFVIMELLIVVFEAFIYVKYFKNVDKKKIIIYTLIANLITMVCTFVIPIVVGIITEYIHRFLPKI